MLLGNKVVTIVTPVVRLDTLILKNSSLLVKYFSQSNAYIKQTSGILILLATCCSIPNTIIGYFVQDTILMFLAEESGLAMARLL